MPSTSTGFTPNLTYSSANESAKVSVSAGGWSDGRVDLLEALGHLGHLVNALGSLFGPGVAAPLREALDDVRSLELQVVDGVIDNEARLRDQVGHLTQQVTGLRAEVDRKRERVWALTDRVIEAAAAEVPRSRRGNRPLPPWAAATIDEAPAQVRGLVPKRDWEWLEACDDEVPF